MNVEGEHFLNIILLSGGSGKRLWSLSNEVRSKQFLKIFKRPDESHESMVQRMYRMIQEVGEVAQITIATSENQVTSINAQLGDAVGISIEPRRRDTFGPSCSVTPSTETSLLFTALLTARGLFRSQGYSKKPASPTLLW
jgi:mannose-1-phosphate guanylyltransferase